jgi:DNA repair exonuclease SbcCD ATPase subunit
MTDDDLENLVKRLHGSVAENLQARIEQLERELEETQEEALDRIEEADRAIANLQREYDKRGDRIEQLQSSNEALERERDEWKSLAEAAIKDDASKNIHYAEVQARNAKAVEALRFYAEGEWPEDYPGGVLFKVDGVTHIDYGHKATAMLAEIESSEAVTPYGLEGGKDD